MENYVKTKDDTNTDFHRVDSDLASTSSTMSSIFGSEDAPSTIGDTSATSSSSGEIAAAFVAEVVLTPMLAEAPAFSSAATATEATARARVKCVGRNNRGVSWGFTSVIGRRKEMEDAVTVAPGFMSRTCDHVGGCTAPGSRNSCEISPVHFFGVYDGHGGSQVLIFFFSIFIFQ